ncbi:hypothetical protein FH972_001488 [Carpinus fangiana]|uniref:Uncharacterized protein n=1 Tax=Carpinus fangiana TaxID=176857 RepID=A0A5N6QC95_9ROSI|nr:hypothetical protein FH972_001488 [Carpinus fangiana]
MGLCTVTVCLVAKKSLERKKTKKKKLAIIHRRELWASCRQPPATFSNNEASPIHLNTKGPTVRIRPNHNQSPGEHWDQNRHRRLQRRHLGASLRPELRQELDQLQRDPLLPCEQDHPHHCRQRGHGLRRPRPHGIAPSGDAEPPERPQRRVLGREDQGLDGPLDGGAQAVGASVFRKL